MTPTPRAGQDDAAARRQQEIQGSVEEKERRAVEESMRRQSGTQTMLTQEDFLSQDVHFAYDSYTLSDEAKSILEQKASWMTTRPDVAVQIEGHCDERGTIAYNLALGERRANTVKQYVTTLGIPSTRLTTISYGEEFPLDPKHNEEAWARNRRAHFAIINQ
jgi:peptidoglycan-associated lipoprotein